MRKNILALRFGAGLFVLASSTFVATAQSSTRPVPLISNAMRISERGAAQAAAAPLDRAAVNEVEWNVSLELFASYLASAKLEGIVADVSTQRAGWLAGFTRRSGARSIDFHLSSEISFYDIGSSTPLVGGSTDPFNDVYDT